MRKTYLNGPQFLHDWNIDKFTNNDPDFQLESEQISDIAIPSIKVVTTDSQVIKAVIKRDNLSSFTKLVRTTAYLKSFIKWWKSFRENRLQSTTIIDRNNLDESRYPLLSLVQREVYHVVTRTSKLLELNPVIQQNYSKVYWRHSQNISPL